MTINTAYYRKVGSLVWIHAFITFAANSSGASMQFGGLPFPANYFGAIPVAYQNWSPAPAGQLTTMASGSLLSVYMGGGFATFANASGGQIYISGVYAT
jgi:hypothetical protein